MATTFTYVSKAPSDEYFPGIGILAPGESHASEVELHFANLVLTDGAPPSTGNTAAAEQAAAATRAAEIEALEAQAAADTAALEALKSDPTAAPTTGASS